MLRAKHEICLNAQREKKLIFVPRTFRLLLSIKNFNLFTFYRLTEWSLLKLSYLIVNAKYESVPTLERSELQYSSSASVRRWSSDVVRLQMTSQSSAVSLSDKSKCSSTTTIIIVNVVWLGDQSLIDSRPGRLQAGAAHTPRALPPTPHGVLAGP